MQDIISACPPQHRPLDLRRVFSTPPSIVDEVDADVHTFPAEPADEGKDLSSFIRLGPSILRIVGAFPFSVKFDLVNCGQPQFSTDQKIIHPPLRVNPLVTLYHQLFTKSHRFVDRAKNLFGLTLEELSVSDRRGLPRNSEAQT